MTLVEFPTQKRFTCTAEDMRAWLEEHSRLGDITETRSFAVAPRLIYVTQEVPPCLGCGRPIRGGADPVLTVDQVAMKAIFHACGCELTISD